MTENIEILKKLIEQEILHELKIPTELLCHYKFVRTVYLNPYNYDNMFHEMKEICNRLRVENSDYIYVYSEECPSPYEFSIYKRPVVESVEIRAWTSEVFKRVAETRRLFYDYFDQSRSQETTAHAPKSCPITECKFKDSDGYCREDVYKEPVGIVPCEKVEDCFIKDLYNKLGLQELKIKEVEDRCQ